MHLLFRETLNVNVRFCNATRRDIAHLWSLTIAIKKKMEILQEFYKIKNWRQNSDK